MTDLESTRDELALDAIAAGRAPEGDLDPALAMLAALRTDLDGAGSPAVVPLRPRLRTGFLVALAAAAGLVVGGITAGAVAVADRPGELLYAAHRAVLGPNQTKPAAVTTLLDRAAGRLARGDRTGARRLIAQASSLLSSVPDEQRPPLRARIADLSALAADPVPRATPSVSPSVSPSADDHGGPGESATSAPTESGDDHETPTPSRSDDHSGPGSGGESSEPGDDHSGSDH